MRRDQEHKCKVTFFFFFFLDVEVEVDVLNFVANPAFNPGGSEPAGHSSSVGHCIQTFHPLETALGCVSSGSSRECVSVPPKLLHLC